MFLNLSFVFGSDGGLPFEFRAALVVDVDFEFDPEGYSKEAAVRLKDNQDNIQELVCYSPAENYEIVEIIDGKKRYKEEKKYRR